MCFISCFCVLPAASLEGCWETSPRRCSRQDPNLIALGYETESHSDYRLDVSKITNGFKAHGSYGLEFSGGFCCGPVIPYDSGRTKAYSSRPMETEPEEMQSSSPRSYALRYRHHVGPRVMRDLSTEQTNR